MSGSDVDVGQQPRLGAVGQIAVGQQDHRRAVLDGDPGRLDGGVEALGRAVARHDGQRRLAVTAEHRDVEVGGLGLGGQAGGGPAALDVDEQQRQLHRHRQRDRLALERHARTRGGGHAEVAGEGGAERHADRCDLVLGLHGADAEVLVLRQLVEDVGRRRDRVRAERDRQLGELAGGDEAPRQRRVARDARVLAGGQRRGPHLVAVTDRLGGLTEVEAGLERRLVGLDHLLVLGELLLDPLERGLGGPGVHERHQAEREEVLRPLGVARLHAERLAGLLGERGHRHLDHPVAGERVVVERALLVVDLLEVALVERVLVDDQRAALLEAMEVGLERRRVHRDEHVGLVAGRGDVVVGDVHLEARHAVDRPRRGTDLGREVGQCRQVVAE